jgi:hypothetical protein
VQSLQKDFYLGTLSSFDCDFIPPMFLIKNLVDHQLGITRHVIGPKVHVKVEIFHYEMDYK